MDQEREYKRGDPDIPPCLDPPARRQRVKDEEADQQKNDFVSDLVGLEIGYRDVEQDCGADQEDEIGEIDIGHEPSSRIAWR